MHDDADETLRLRRRDDDAQADASQVDETPAPGSVTVLGVTTTDGSYPTAANRCYAITVTQILGDESEGATASFSSVPGKIYAYNLGSAVPPLGTQVPCNHVPHRWVFRYDG